MRAADTNVVVRLVVRDDPRQVSAAERFVAKGAWVSLVVLAEVIWVLESVYELEPQRLARTIDMLLEHEHLTLDAPDVVQRALQDFRAKPAVGFSDCLVLASARKAGHLPLGTFERELARLDGAERL